MSEDAVNSEHRTESRHHSTDVDRDKEIVAGKQLAGKRPRKLVVLERQSSKGGEASGAPTGWEGPRYIEVVQ